MIFVPLMRMKALIYKISVLLLFTVALTSFNSDEKKNYPHEDGYVRWSDRKLEWSDFKGEVPQTSKFHALTNSAINLEFETVDQHLVFKIESIFDPGTSWKKEGVTPYILNHEQIHFDITEYHTRQLRKELMKKKFHSFATVSREVREMVNDAHEKTGAMQLEYDHDTDHSLNKKKQEKWNRKVARLMRKTDDYQATTIKIDISYLME